jgi:hypothetical protein
LLWIIRAGNYSPSKKENFALIIQGNYQSKSEKKRLSTATNHFSRSQSAPLAVPIFTILCRFFAKMTALALPTRLPVSLAATVFRAGRRATNPPLVDFY